MQIIKTLAPQPEALANTYVVHIEYEHGDADSRDESCIYIQTDEDLVKVVNVVDYLSEMISMNRGGYKYPSEFVEQYLKNGGYVKVEGTKYSIELQYDMFADISNYYAAMEISKIEWYDNTGCLFNVQVIGDE